MSPRRRAMLALTAALGLAATAPGAAQAAVPTNDAAGGAVEFAAITAENGRPAEREGIAELVEATADAGVARCLGAGSFDRTVWFSVPAAATPRELSVEASGRTLAVLDVAAFVQPEGATAPVTAEPNACSGVGAGGADASEEPTAGVALRVPAGRAVLIQVGRRGARGSAEDERAVLSLNATELPATPAPAGDVADDSTPALEGGVASVALAGATLTEEDPAQPPCPSLGSVWRRVVPERSGSRTIVAAGDQVGSLTVFSGDRPAGDNARGCVNRERRAGSLVLSVRARRGVPLWIRLGTDRPAGDATATLAIEAGRAEGDGGPGGGPPVIGRTESCSPRGLAPSGPRAGHVRFRAVSARIADLQRSGRLVVRVAQLTGRRVVGRVLLVDSCGRVHARSAVESLRTGGRVPLELAARRELTAGTYRLQVVVRSGRGERTEVQTTGTVRLR